MAISDVNPETSAAMRNERTNSSAVEESKPRVELSQAAIGGPVLGELLVTLQKHCSDLTSQNHLCDTDTLSLSSANTSDKVIANLCVACMGFAKSVTSHLIGRLTEHTQPKNVHGDRSHVVCPVLTRNIERTF